MIALEMAAPEKNIFAESLLDWFAISGRKNLPWQKQPTPYRVWVSEVMLQQTQVITVIDRFEAFITRFPAVNTLAEATMDEVLALWSGLGYYARGRNLHKAAVIVVQEHNGELPDTLEGMMALPGVGRSTAAAVLSLSRGQRQTILDGNVKRVLARCHTIDGWTGNTKIQQHLWTLAEKLTPEHDVGAYNQAMMDLGATVCTRSKPRCDDCPVSHCCKANQDSVQQYFPVPKPKKQLPVRQRHMAIITNSEGAVLLQQRPPSGIWGGLWCFPSFENQTALMEWLEGRGWIFSLRNPWGKVRHSFTHFHLDIQPVPIQVHTMSLVVEESSELWYKSGSLPVGLPAPVSRLLEKNSSNTDIDEE